MNPRGPEGPQAVGRHFSDVSRLAPYLARRPRQVFETPHQFFLNSFALSWECKVVLVTYELKARFQQCFDLFWLPYYLHSELVAS